MPCSRPRVALMHRSVKCKLRFLPKTFSFRLEDGSDLLISKDYLSRNRLRLQDWKPLRVPCGGCLWCRLQRRREMAIRVVHESSLYLSNSFLTLTYSPEFIPKDGSYSYVDVQEFMKRLRSRHEGLRIRSYGCAEYGSQFSRPHFHLCIFNYDFPDKVPWRLSTNDWSNQKWHVSRSQELEELWPYGFSEIGTLTPESASYVAGYINKKVSGKKARSHYGSFLPERSVCVSKGIGIDWLRKFTEPLMVNDSVIFKHKPVRIPRYYCKKLEQWFPDRYELVKAKRLAKIKEIDLDGTPSRVATIEQFQQLEFNKSIRRYEDGEVDGVHGV